MIDNVKKADNGYIVELTDMARRDHNPQDISDLRPSRFSSPYAMDDEMAKRENKLNKSFKSNAKSRDSIIAREQSD